MKYIIEIENEPFVRDEKLYRAKGFKSLVFDQIGLDKLMPYKPVDPDAIEKARKAGQDEAWEAVKKIFGSIENGGYTRETVEIIFERFTGGEIPFDYTAQEAIDRVKKYEEEQKEILVGDEIAFHYDDRPDTVVVVTYIGPDGFIDGMDGKGTQYAHKNPKKWTKTGRHFESVRKLLQEMKGE